MIAALEEDSAFLDLLPPLNGPALERLEEPPPTLSEGVADILRRFFRGSTAKSLGKGGIAHLGMLIFICMKSLACANLACGPWPSLSSGILCAWGGCTTLGRFKWEYLARIASEDTSTRGAGVLAFSARQLKALAPRKPKATPPNAIINCSLMAVLIIQIRIVNGFDDTALAQVTGY